MGIATAPGIGPALRRSLTDKAAPTDVGIDEAHGNKLFIGSGDGGAIQLQKGGKLTVGGQAGASRQGTALNETGQMLHNAPIQGSATGAAVKV